MLTLNEPQIWTIIGVMSAALIGMLTLSHTALVRVIRAEIGGVNARIDGVEKSLSARLDSMNMRIDNLDRDVQFLMNKEVR